MKPYPASPGRTEAYECSLFTPQQSKEVMHGMLLTAQPSSQMRLDPKVHSLFVGAPACVGVGGNARHGELV
jgi:hypothetical protein